MQENGGLDYGSSDYGTPSASALTGGTADTSSNSANNGAVAESVAVHIDSTLTEILENVDLESLEQIVGDLLPDNVKEPVNSQGSGGHR